MRETKTKGGLEPRFYPAILAKNRFPRRGEPSQLDQSLPSFPINHAFDLMEPCWDRRSWRIQDWDVFP